MRLLIDTQAFLWLAGEPARLSATARRAIKNIRNERHFSLASAFEMALKVEIGKLKLPFAFGDIPAVLAKFRMRLLPIELRHLERLVRLPVHHKDPFDRLLIAQAMEEQFSVVTNDPGFKHYDVKRIC
jgi:PIN domain nuclease of toxin-antitoxin system